MSNGVTPLVMAAETREEFFEKKVRPLLIQHCYECHGDEEIKGGLRLNSRAGWQTGGDSGPALVPHQPEESLLIKAIAYKDRDLKMPPKGRLADKDMAVLQQWVAEGAYDPREGAIASTADEQKRLSLEKGREFWSFKLPVKTAPPPVTDASWPRDVVDQFILASLEEKGLPPAPAASKQTLVRRVYFDLIGLPPTLKDWQAFARLEKQHGAKALGLLVDQLIALPQFSERWGRHWLDLARFAESSGGGRTLPFKDAWRYRDYVIQSLHEDVPLNQFITEQICGDLMPYETVAQRQRQLTATGFLALGPTNYEEQDKGVLRMDIIDEQMETIGRGFLGMTLSCARCHDHKFDPISAHDYYAMAGILRSTRTLKNYTDNVARWIDVALPLEGETEQKQQAHEAILASLEKDLRAATKELKRLQPNGGKKKSFPIDDLPGIVVDETKAHLTGAWVESIISGGVHKGYFHDQNGEEGLCKAVFNLKATKAGSYSLQMASSPNSNRSSKTKVLVSSPGGTEELVINQKNPPPVDKLWFPIRDLQLKKDAEVVVTISNEGANGFVVVDAVRLLPKK